MKTIAAIALTLGVLGLMICVVPARASAADESSWSLGEILELGSEVLTEALRRGVDEIQDHIEFKSNTLPGGREGETSTQLRLRLFPKGKNHPEEQIGADTELQYSLDPKRPHFNFNLKILPRQDPDDYI